MRGTLITSLGAVIALAGYQVYSLMMQANGSLDDADGAFDPTFWPTIVIIGLGVLIAVIGIAYLISNHEQKQTTQK